MLTTIEAEIDVNGEVTFLEPLRINKKSRAIITLLDDKKKTAPKKAKVRNGNVKAEKDLLNRQLEWLKANQEKYGGQYVVLDGDKLLGTAKDFREGHLIAKESGVSDAFITYLSKPDEDGHIGGFE